MAGLLTRAMSPPRMRAQSAGSSSSHLWSDAGGWVGQLEATGMSVSPELALTLSHVHCAVSTISDDVGISTCQLFRDLGDDGRARVKYRDPGIGALAYKLQWQPNVIQSAKAFWSTLVWQYLLRPAAYAEIIYRPGSDSFVDQIWPRHPDRVQQEVLSDGRVRFKMIGERDGPRYVTQDEMLVVRNTSTDGLNAISRVSYGAQAIRSGLTLQNFTSNYFEHGASAALLGAYKDDLDEEALKDLHGNVKRYMSGVENAGGLLLVNVNDIDIKQLGVDPEKAELLGLKNLSGRDIARMFKMQPSKLMIQESASYGSKEQDAADHVTRCLLPIFVEVEQAIKRDLIVAKDQFFAKFNADYLLRGDLLSRMQAYEIGIRSRMLRPSEARVREDMSPDKSLDALSERDYQPGQADAKPSNEPRAVGAGRTSRADLRLSLMTHDAAVRCVRREAHQIEKIAKKHPSDVVKWHKEQRAFLEEHAGFVASTMRLDVDVARAFVAQHGAVFEAKGIVGMTEQWQVVEAEALAALSLEGEASEGHIGAAPVRVTVPVTIAAGAVQVDARTTVEGARVDVQPAAVTIAKGAVQVDVAAAEPPHVDVHAGDVHIDRGAVAVTLPSTAAAVERVTEVERDEKGLIVRQRSRDVPVKKKE